VDWLWGFVAISCRQPSGRGSVSVIREGRTVSTAPIYCACDAVKCLERIEDTSQVT
jgi:hypothetical protein